MKRDDWLERLWETIEARRRLPFRWGGSERSQDCCTFTSACIEAMTGRFVLGDLLTHYNDEASAKAYINECGGLVAAVSLYLDEPKRLGYMGRGDVAVFMDRGKEAVGICVGHEIVSTGKAGTIAVPRSNAIAAWEV